MIRRKNLLAWSAVFLLVIAHGSLEAQEMFNVNIWNTGRPANRGGIWNDGFDDDEEIATLMLDGATPAGAPGWNTVQWENVELDPNPFAKLTPAVTITGTLGSTATFEMYNRRNAAPYNWDSVRDDSDVEDVGNATLLDGHVNSTEFDDANGGGNVFGFQISDFEIRDIPFASYDAVIYLGINGGQTYSGNGTIRINDDVHRPSDPSDWAAGVIDEGPLDDSGGTQFTLPASLQGFEPDGILDEIESSGDVGNYIVFEGLTGPTLKVQTWGEGFTHLGLAGFQIRGVASLTGDYNANGELDAGDLDLQAVAMVEGLHPAKFDLNGDNLVNYDDRLAWVDDLKRSWIGDANLDLEFNSGDMVDVFLAGKYESDQDAGWAEGDWNGDRKFGSADMVAAFLDGGYELGQRPPVAAVNGVPEPSGWLLLSAGLLSCLSRRQGRRRE